MSSRVSVIYTRANNNPMTAGPQEFLFSDGLLGFSGLRRYKLDRFDSGDGNESPFFILRSLEAEVSFPLIHPNWLPFDYELTLDESTLRTLQADSAKQLDVFLIVTLRERLEDITVNLQGPLVFNLASLRGVQLVVEHFPVRQPLLKPSPV
jgi:flagellar assembly factor FliW